MTRLLNWSGLRRGGGPFQKEQIKYVAEKLGHGKITVGIQWECLSLTVFTRNLKKWGDSLDLWLFRAPEKGSLLLSKEISGQDNPDKMQSALGCDADTGKAAQCGCSF